MRSSRRSGREGVKPRLRHAEQRGPRPHGRRQGLTVAMSKSTLTSFFTLTVPPPALIGLMPKARWLTVADPRNRSFVPVTSNDSGTLCPCSERAPSTRQCPSPGAPRREGHPGRIYRSWKDLLHSLDRSNRRAGAAARPPKAVPRRTPCTWVTRQVRVSIVRFLLRGGAHEDHVQGPGHDPHRDPPAVRPAAGHRGGVRGAGRRGCHPEGAGERETGRERRRAAEGKGHGRPEHGRNPRAHPWLTRSSTATFSSMS